LHGVDTHRARHVLQLFDRKLAGRRFIFSQFDGFFGSTFFNRSVPAQCE
jgi:hypothetical protein